MKYNTEKYHGVFVALNAIYDKDDNVNLSVIKELVKKYRDAGVNGIYACGSTGEGFLLSVDERKKIAEAVKEAAGDDMAVIVHIGSASTKEAIELARHSEEIGVDAISAVPSVYYRLPEESIALHWNTITEAVDLPFIIYNIPQLTGYDLTYSLFNRIIKNKKVIGIKNSSESVCQIERFATLGGKNFVVFNGSDEQFLAGRLMGAKAGIGGTYGCMPELFVHLDSLIERGDMENAQIWQHRINECIFDLLACPSLYGASKAVISRRYGVDAGKPRLPFLPLDKDDPRAVAITEKIERFIKMI
ncbi:MAG: dihydrodipicolinate synthase family protein [Oscillospiraceae bacterium]|nr:dihydrodipicolinate synthase family protein [Oscillospiraceae bacterium]